MDRSDGSRNGTFGRHPVCDGTGGNVWKSVRCDDLCDFLCIPDDRNVYFPLYRTVPRDDEADFQECAVYRDR